MQNQENVMSAQEFPEGTQMIWGRFQGEGGYYECDFIQGVEYANREGNRLHVDIIVPMVQKEFPLIVFVQGSAWRTQPIHLAYSKMFHMASRGYVAAMVEYRNTNLAQYPAPVEDTQTAIRFLKKNAQKYGIDKNRVAVWGDSSGGHVALMTGFLPGRFANGLYEGETDEVNAIVDYYGITDIANLGVGNDALDHDSDQAPEALLLGAAVTTIREKANAASPLYNIPDGETPPLLIVHGDSDGVVNVSQSIQLYKKMRNLGKTVYFTKIMNADHGMGIWQKEVFDLTDNFLRNTLFHPRVDKPLFQHED